MLNKKIIPTFIILMINVFSFVYVVQIDKKPSMPNVKTTFLAEKFQPSFDFFDINYQRKTYGKEDSHLGIHYGNYVEILFSDKEKSELEFAYTVITNTGDTYPSYFYTKKIDSAFLEMNVVFKDDKYLLHAIRHHDVVSNLDNNDTNTNADFQAFKEKYQNFEIQSTEDSEGYLYTNFYESTSTSYSLKSKEEKKYRNMRFNSYHANKTFMDKDYYDNIEYKNNYTYDWLLKLFFVNFFLIFFIPLIKSVINKVEVVSFSERAIKRAYSHSKNKKRSKKENSLLIKNLKEQIKENKKEEIKHINTQTNKVFEIENN